MRTNFEPSWFKFIENKKPIENIESTFLETDYIEKIPNAESKYSFAILRDGVLFPPTTGQAYHLLNLQSAFTKKGIRTIIFRNYRGWEKLKYYEHKNIPAVLINPKCFYSNVDLMAYLVRKFEIKYILIDDPEVILLQGSYLKTVTNVKIVYDAPNIDFALSRELSVPRKLIDREIELFRKAEKIFDVCWVKSNSDKLAASAVLDKNNKIHQVPLGVNTSEISYSKKTLQPNKKYKGIFLGNLFYEPNKQALPILDKLGKQLRKMLDIVIIGDGEQNLLRNTYINLNFVGSASDIKKVISKYDIAFCPLLTGSGMSLKILDYLAAGVPTITTKKGIRGCEGNIENAVLLSDQNEFVENTKKLLTDKDLYEQLSIVGREYVVNNYDWNKIATKYIKTLELS